MARKAPGITEAHARILLEALHSPAFIALPASAVKRVPADWLHPRHTAASQVLADARRAEAKAKARLRAACAKADPATVVLDADLVPIPAKSLGGVTRGGDVPLSLPKIRGANDC